MNFDFDDTRYALRDLARDLFAHESPVSRVREIRDGKPVDKRVWRTMAEAGLCGITVPESYGGAGGSELDLTLVYEEAGRSALPEPLLELTGIAAPVVAIHGTDAQKDRWLPSIASGDVDVDVRIDGTDVIIGDDRIANAHIDAYARAFSGTASILNGVAMRELEMTTAYVKDRTQFGKPVGSFQAVKHKLAAMHVAIASSRPAAWYAAYALSTGLEGASIAACVAKVAANDTEELCNGDALQCHAGIGFTWEHDLHLWLKLGMELRGSYGSSLQLRRNLVRAHTLEELL
jgi:alkylation response protein AidB-like acyl-CoA dehydrogenase